MSLAPLQLDYAINTYLAVHISPVSSYITDPSSISTIHPALTHVGPVGVMKDIQILSVPKAQWNGVSDEVLDSFRGKAGITKVEVQQEPKLRVKRGDGEL